MEKKMGRPKSVDPKNKIVGVRFSEEQYKRLLAYCEAAGLSITETVTKAVEKMLSGEDYG